MPSTGDATWVASNLLALVGLAPESELGGDHRGEAFSAWRLFFEAMADQRPLVLVFEDLHWADDGLLDFVDELVEWVTDVPLLVVATARPELLERRPGWGGGKLNSTTLALQPLSDDETARLIGHLLDRPVLVAELPAARSSSVRAGILSMQSSSPSSSANAAPSTGYRSRRRCRASSPPVSTA